MRALQHWGSKWADLTPEQAHPGVVLWMWATFFLTVTASRSAGPWSVSTIRRCRGRAAAAGC